MAEIRNTAKLDSKPFTSELGKLQGQVEGFAAKAGSQMARAFSTGAIIAFAKNALSMADQIDNLARQTDFSIEAVQSLGVIVKDAGMQFEQVRPVINRMRRSVEEAKGGNEALADSFKTLGIDMNELRKMRTEDVLEAVSRAMVNNEGDAQVSIAATRVLGSESTRLNGVLKQLAEEGFDGLNQRLVASGQIMSTSMVQSLDRMEQRFTVLSRQVQTGGASIASAFLQGVDSIGQLVGAMSAGASPAAAWAQMLEDVHGSAQKARNSTADLSEETARLAMEQAKAASAFHEIEKMLFAQQMAMLPLNEQLEQYEKTLANLQQQSTGAFFDDDPVKQLEILKEMEKLEKRIADIKKSQAQEAERQLKSDIAVIEKELENMRMFRKEMADIMANTGVSGFGSGASLERIGGFTGSGGDGGIVSMMEREIRIQEQIRELNRRQVEIMERNPPLTLSEG